MKKGFSICFISTLLFPLLSQAGAMHNLRNQRYCEIIISQNVPSTGFFNLDVYNTLGLNDCPSEAWNAISVEKVKKMTGAVFVALNGPRYFVIDGVKDTKVLNSTPKQFDGLSMRLAGILTLSTKDYKQSLPYQPHSIHRHTTWVYLANKPIYELTDPMGQRYVMQSYSLQKLNQNIDDLKNLGSKLTLPKGWSFSTKTLQKTSDLTAIDQQTQVVQDDFLNTYQIETDSFVKNTHK